MSEPRRTIRLKGVPEAERDGLVTGFEREFLTLDLPCAFPPGAPVSLAITLRGQRVALQGKALGSKRAAHGRFVVRLRLVTLRRQYRLALEEIFAGSSDRP